MNICREAKASPAARVSAANAILDRGYGKPAQFNTEDPQRFRSVAEMTDDELAAIALQGLREAQPNVSLAWIARELPMKRSEDREHYLDGLRRAGLK